MPNIKKKTGRRVAKEIVEYLIRSCDAAPSDYAKLSEQLHKYLKENNIDDDTSDIISVFTSKTKEQETNKGPAIIPGSHADLLAMIDSEDPNERRHAAISLAAEQVEPSERRQMAVLKMWSLLLDPAEEVSSAALGTLQQWGTIDQALGKKLADLASPFSQPPSIKSEISPPVAIPKKLQQSWEQLVCLGQSDNRRSGGLVEAMKVVKQVIDNIRLEVAKQVGRVIANYIDEKFRSEKEKYIIRDIVNYVLSSMNLALLCHNSNRPGRLQVRTGKGGEEGVGQLQLDSNGRTGTSSSSANLPSSEVVLAEPPKKPGPQRKVLL